MACRLRVTEVDSVLQVQDIIFSGIGHRKNISKEMVKEHFGNSVKTKASWRLSADMTFSRRLAMQC